MKISKRDCGCTGILLMAVCLTAGGCNVVQDILGGQRPTASVTGVSLKDISLDSVTMLFDVKVSNPYSVPLPLVNLDYALASQAQSFLSGRAPLQGTIPAQDSKTLQLPAKVNYLELVKAVKGLRLGMVVPYVAEMGLSVDAPAVGAIRLPLRKEGQLPVPAPPGVSVAQIRWDAITLDKAGGTVKLNIVNRNQFPVSLRQLGYNLSLGEVKVAETSVAKAVAFEPGASGDVEIPISLSPRNFGLAVFKMLTGSSAGYTIGGLAELDTPYGPMGLPFTGSGQTALKR